MHWVSLCQQSVSGLSDPQTLLGAWFACVCVSHPVVVVGRGPGDAIPLRAAGALIGPDGLAVRWTRREEEGMSSNRPDMRPGALNNSDLLQIVVD